MNHVAIDVRRRIGVLVDAAMAGVDPKMMGSAGALAKIRATRRARRQVQREQEAERAARDLALFESQAGVDARLAATIRAGGLPAGPHGRLMPTVDIDRPMLLSTHQGSPRSPGASTRRLPARVCWRERDQKWAVASRLLLDGATRREAIAASRMLPATFRARLKRLMALPPGEDGDAGRLMPRPSTAPAGDPAPPPFSPTPSPASA